MSESESLVPFFVPALAVVLALAEKKKGSPLTEAEVKSARDKSPCIMLTKADAEKMAQSREYVDVNPDNCWADWHRLRVQIIGGYLPKIVLCIPGNDTFRAQCEPFLTTEKIEHEFRPHEESILRAFQSSSLTWPCFSPQDFERIDAHTTVLYVLSQNFVSADAPAIGRRFLNLGRRLLDFGGIAIKCESSGISHAPARWSMFDDKADLNAAAKWQILFHAYVVYPIGSNTDLYTCGMHLLGAPDLTVSQSVIQKSTKAGQTAASAAAALFRAFALYLLSECPVGKFASGHTFSLDRESPRYRVVWEPCADYAEDTLFFNPFGRWRFTTP